MIRLVKVTAMPAGKNIGRVPNILRDEVVGKEVVVFPARRTFHGFDPEKILNVGLEARPGAPRSITFTKFTLEVQTQYIHRLLVGDEVEILDFLPHDPPCHWVDVRC